MFVERCLHCWTIVCPIFFLKVNAGLSHEKIVKAINCPVAKLVRKSPKGQSPDDFTNGRVRLSFNIAGNLFVSAITAYIPPNFQVIAANDLLYISSSRGLYAFRYDTGELVWRYDTELPLGNSPTIATVNDKSLAVVGGYDRKLHAFDALTGQPVWEFSGAKAGFDATYGARPLRRFIADNIEEKIAEQMLSGNLKRGSQVQVTLQGSQLVFNQ